MDNIQVNASFSGNTPSAFPFKRYENALKILDDIGGMNVALLAPQWPPCAEEFQGGFGCVRVAFWNNQKIAVKFLSDRWDDGMTSIGRQEQPFRRELAMWHKLLHPNVLPLLGVVCLKNAHLGMASPYMANGSAPRYIDQNPKVNVLQILCDVAEGMGYLAVQTTPIAHGDIKGANVLINSDGRACICDFGLSRFIEGCKPSDVSCSGTIRWMAPEQLVTDPMIVSLSADVFSWGMLALELMTGSKPWADVENEVSIIPRVLAGGRPDRPKVHSKLCKSHTRCVCLVGHEALWELIQRCWRGNPDQRPNITELRTALSALRSVHHE